MKIRDRIIELRRVPASELLPNPKNWRTHPTEQQEAMRGVLAEVGIADAVLARETPDGLMLIDGHLRADVAADVEWPVLVLDVTEEEADKLLLTHDPLSAMAGADESLLYELTNATDISNPALNQMLADLAQSVAELNEPQGPGEPPPEVAIPELFQVVVVCESEDEQAQVYEKMTQEGYQCRVLTL